jgi:hypothetical protein
MLRYVLKMLRLKGVLIPRYSPKGEDTHNLRLASKLSDLRFGYAAYRLRYLAMRAEESLTKIERYAYNKVGASGNTGLRCKSNGTAVRINALRKLNKKALWR